jgi:hypothetical protein
MAAISGTNLLFYADGKAIALQKGISITLDVELPDATNKESAGWNQHVVGNKSAKVDFSALMDVGLIGDTPPVVMSVKALMDYVTGSNSLLVVILGLGYPIIGEADISTLAFDASDAQAMVLTGSVKVKGALYVLSAAIPNLVTDPDAGTTDYDTLTVADLSITSAVKSSAGAKFCQTNTISIADTGVYKLALFLTKTSGALPTVGLWDNTSAYISNSAVLAEGLNLVTLTATSTDASASLRFSNTANANWSTSPIYLFKP